MDDRAKRTRPEITYDDLPVSRQLQFPRKRKKRRTIDKPMSVVSIPGPLYKKGRSLNTTHALQVY
ncbi:hypothetical protein Acid7E03_41320 [Acidisoma sp. 7E03]